MWDIVSLPTDIKEYNNLTALGTISYNKDDSIDAAYSNKNLAWNWKTTLMDTNDLNLFTGWQTSESITL